MKRRVILLLLFFPARLFAQQLSGTVLDKNTHLPVPYATVTGANTITFTLTDGNFSISNISPGDSIKITSIGYKPYKMGFDIFTPLVVTVYLQPASILLQDVLVKLKHDPSSIQYVFVKSLLQYSLIKSQNLKICSLLSIPMLTCPIIILMPPTARPQ